MVEVLGERATHRCNEQIFFLDVREPISIQPSFTACDIAWSTAVEDAYRANEEDNFSRSE